MTEPVTNTTGVSKSTSTPMKVSFYYLDKKTKTKGKLAGSAILRNGALDIKTNDPNLKKLLKSRVLVKGGAVQKRVMPNGKEIYIGGEQMNKPGTREHLEAVIHNSESYGFIAEPTK